MRYASKTDRLAGLGSDKWAVHVAARARKADGEDIIELTIGEPDMKPPQPVIEAVVDALHAGRTRYSDGRGERAALDAIAAKYSSRAGREVGRDQVIYFPGTQTALYAAMQAIAETGDEVLVGDPAYATYEGVVRATGADMVSVPLRPENGFHMRAADLEACVTPKSRTLLLNSPHNPTGATLSAEAIAEIGAVCREHDLWIVSDEVYEAMTYHRPFASPFDNADLAERTVVVSSISKSHAVPGFRAGWAVGPKPFIDRLLPLAETMLFGAQPFIADAAAFALATELPETKAIVDTFRRRADHVCEWLSGATGLACAEIEGGMFAMVDVRATGLSGEDFAWRLLDEEKVAVMPGEAFGTQTAGHLRVSLSLPDDVLEEACQRMRRLAELLVRGQAA